MADRELLRMALDGYQIKLLAIEAKMREIRSLPTVERGIRTALDPTQDIRLVPKKPARRVISAVGRRRMSLAQKRRWAQRKAS